ncbi:MAG: siphovirus ReqiPepy6 Gp37-like family protein [Oscillospiraceae bacterium]|jgi:hypothetical protein|nr:siphovirus ReqiPepy6 Gp37-like family protein [Oscillospiraceae bacterium]
MKNIYLLDSNFKTIALLDDYSRLSWRRRYYDCGGFELICGKKGFAQAESAAYILLSGHDELGIIDSFKLTDSGGELSGVFATQLLNERVMYPMVKLKGNAELLLREQVKSRLGVALRPIIGREPFPLNLDTQLTGGTLLEWAQGLCRSNGWGCELGFNQASRRLEFYVFKGEDRRRGNGEREAVILSSQWGTAKDCELDFTQQELKNIAIVAGEDLGALRKHITVDIRAGDEPARELWVDARDLQQRYGMSDSEYYALLEKRGREKLAKHAIQLEFKCGGTQKLEFGLGDLINLKLGSFFGECRAVGFDETFTKTECEVKALFGEVKLVG